MTKNFNFNDISKYRVELMGISTLLIILCHAPAHIPTMHPLVASLLAKCAYGVDVFLALSGLGLWYSLSKSDSFNNLLSWYKKRYLRLLLPCLIVQILFISKPDILHHILFFFGISFFTHGDGFWFVDMLIPLYLIAPLLYKVSVRKYGVILLTILCLGCFLFCAIPSDLPCMDYLKQVMTRVPSFLFGFIMAKAIKEGTSKNVYSVAGICYLLLPILSVVSKRYISADIMVGPFFMPSILLISCILLNINWLNWGGWKFLGQISLESYLLNVSISFILDRVLDGYMSRYAIYLVTATLGIALAYLIHIATQPILKKLS